VPAQAYFDDPIDHMSVEDQRLTFTITVRGVNVLYQADWDPGADRWIGVWTQTGIGTPLSFARGTLPALPVVQGLDGLWDGRLTGSAGEPVRLTFRVLTDERGSLAWLESSRQEGVWHGAVSINRDGADIAIAMRTLSVRGRLSEDGGQIEGHWTRDKTTCRWSWSGERLARQLRASPRPKRSPWRRRPWRLSPGVMGQAGACT
jgi:hypothetical protein